MAEEMGCRLGKQAQREPGPGPVACNGESSSALDHGPFATALLSGAAHYGALGAIVRKVAERSPLSGADFGQPHSKCECAAARQAANNASPSGLCPEAPRPITPPRRGRPTTKHPKTSSALAASTSNTNATPVAALVCLRIDSPICLRRRTGVQLSRPPLHQARVCDGDSRSLRTDSWARANAAENCDRLD